MSKRKSENNLKTIIQGSNYEDGKLFRICPKCHKQKPVSEFGLRNMDKEKGPVRIQSYCNKCR